MSLTTQLPTALASIQPHARKTRRECSYNEEERALLGKYKKEYKSKTIHQEREMLLRNYILVDIFNHWSTKNVKLDEMEVHKWTKVYYFIFKDFHSQPIPGALSMDFEQLAA